MNTTYDKNVISYYVSYKSVYQELTIVLSKTPSSKNNLRSIIFFKLKNEIPDNILLHMILEFFFCKTCPLLRRSMFERSFLVYKDLTGNRTGFIHKA